MIILRVTGIVIMLLGIAFKITGMPGYTTLFIAGAAMILLARIAMHFRTSRKNS